MPRRVRPKKLFLTIGERLKAFRLAAGLTQEEVAEGHAPGESFANKGHISSIEHGLANPTVETLQRIAEALEGDVELVDLVIDPDESLRHAVIALSRTLPDEVLGEILVKYGPVPELVPRKRKRTHHRASGARPKAR
ncbi:helix-turn-helix domain-containing protein [Polyangium jinanense]|uniref:Helix-turn-helix transcriptional regulator n=1 Tax=Polyangium jinanense TaxID=2829994 RepID=A0A9X3X2N8_9BACT|nr:helix-turn-helix transcriptional regulator [Polyangium jinanense]MDC3958598.1 helix-turn-helix transcriptional regulator [Polyangium jinanense]MDC3983094.1 helix-turn-helix transcriptional regulator [Polyangium jinanense]